MSYKLHIEKAHRKTKGGDRPRQIEKGVPFGRTLRVYQTLTRNGHSVSENHFTHVHATRKNKTRQIVLPPFRGAF